MVSAPVDLDRRGCAIDLTTILLDGAVRDRCPYIGDQAVTGMTLLVSQDDVRVLRDMLVWFAANQNEDGSIPASPFRDDSLVLVDYNAYWIESLYDYVLYTGDHGAAAAGLAEPRPARRRALSGPRGRAAARQLARRADYAYIPRGGTRVAYYNAQYVRALKLAAALAGWDGDERAPNRWRGARGDGAPGHGAFWDANAGAFRDTTAGTDVHALDGNAFAILAGLATPSQAQSVLAYIERTMRRSYGNSVADTDGWRGANWGDGDYQRVYPFVAYFEVLARYSAGADASALELIRREWGSWRAGPGDDVGDDAGGVGPVDISPSWDHGWSSGAAPALTNYVLGVQPTSPGFATFTVSRTRAGSSRRGVVPTPHGPIRV